MEELLNYYSNLLIIQYHNKPKAIATIKAVIEVLLANNIFFQINDAFDIDTATGVQLDVIGKYVDLDRFNKGIELDDDDYRIAIKFRAVQNNINHSTGSIATSLFQFFGTDVSMVDELNMNITYFVPAPFTDLIQTLLDKEVLPRPMAVGISNVIETNDYFSFVSADSTIADVNIGFATPDNFLTKEGIFLGTDNILI